MNDKFKLTEKAKQTLKAFSDSPITTIEIADITEFQPFRKMAFEIAESFDKKIMEIVIELAREQGYTDLCLLNKEFVVEAFKREIERRRKDNEV